jgi:hypothetical protein
LLEGLTNMYLRESSLPLGYGGYSGRHSFGSALGLAPPPPRILGPAAAVAAIGANRRLARQIGWGCVIGINARPIPQLRTFLGLGATASEGDLAEAVARWQRGQGLTANGNLDQTTWQRMLAATPPVIPRTTYKPFSQTVTLGSSTLGVIEKTMPLRRCFFAAGSNTCSDTRAGTAGERGGMEIQLGFRVTDMAAVTAAGFVDGGEDNFRWIQVVEFVTIPSGTSPTGFIRRHGRVIDPTTLVGAPIDPHPYYWDEVAPAGVVPEFRRFANIQGRNLLCYDTIFEDAPKFRLTAAQPGRRAYFNFEVALVGVRPRNVASGTPTRNVILNTVLWGFDLVVEGGATNVKLNALRAGPFGGSVAFRRVVNAATLAGQFPNHCFVGPGYTGAALCA